MSSFFDNRARAAAAAAAAATASSSKAPLPTDASNRQPWVEKYRPKTLDDVAAQEHTTNVLRRTLQSANLPHMLFYGPPGTGKTSTILALAKQLYGPELMRSRVLELNASDERGINIVRQKVKDFARIQLSNSSASSLLASSSAGAGVQGKKYPCPPFKLIILDEADSMTADAQAALRRTIELYAKITRFCLVCNYVTRIIDPLASRCAKFRFKKLKPQDACRRVEEIAALEGVRLARGASDALVACADGDLRRAVTFLQSAAKLAGATGKVGKVGKVESDGSGGRSGQNGVKEKKGRKGKRKGKAVIEDDEDDEEGGRDDDDDNKKPKDEDAMDVDDPTSSSSSSSAVTAPIVKEIAGIVPDADLQRLLQAMQPSSSTSTSSSSSTGKSTSKTTSSTPTSTSKNKAAGLYAAISAVVTDLVADGWSAAQLVAQLYEAVLRDERIADVQKNEILMVFSEVDKRLVDGADEHLAVLDLALRTAGIAAGA